MTPVPVLKRMTKADTHQFYTLVSANNERLRSYFPVTARQAETEQGADAAIEEYEKQWEANEQRIYGVWLDGELAGVLYLKHIDARHQKTELGYWMGAGYEGKGICTNVVRQAVDIVFDELGLGKAYCKIDVDNAASRRVAEKAGFKLEGILRREYKIIGGETVDTAYYGMIREDI